MGLDVTNFTKLLFSYVDQKQCYIRSIGPILRAKTISFRSPIDSRGPGQFKMFRFVSVICRSIFHYYIILFQAREPRKITGGPTGKDPEDMVLIGYIYPIHLPEIRPKTVCHFYNTCLPFFKDDCHFPKWGRETHFRKINSFLEGRMVCSVQLEYVWQHF